MINVTGGLTVGGASTINITFSNPGTMGFGTYDLFGYGGSSTGFGGTNASGTSIGNLTLNTAGLPSGFIYVLANNSGANQIDLDVLSGAISWGGQNGSAWDTTTSNWYNFNAVSTNFSTATPVSFGDTQYSGGPMVTNSNITISGTGGVSPASVTFNNTNTPVTGVAYTITSSDSTNLGITGSAGVTLNGTGTVTFVGQNTYTGATTLNAGTLIISNINSIGNASAPLVFNGGTLQYAPGLASNSSTTDISLGRSVTISSGGATIDLNGNNVSFGSSIGSGGTGALTVVDSGSAATLTLSNANTFTGAMNLNGGVVNFAALNNLGSGSAINFNGGTLQWASGNAANISSSTVTIGAGGATLDINGNNVSLAGSIGNSGTGALTVLNSGSAATLTLASSNAYSGATNLNGGTVRFSSINSLGTGSAINFNGGALQWGTGNTANISSRTVTIGAGGATFDINGNNVSLGNSIGNAGSGGLTVLSSGNAATLTLAAGNNYGGTTNVNSGILRVSNTNPMTSATGTGPVHINNSSVLTGTGYISGSVTAGPSATISPSLAGTAAEGSISTLSVGGLTLGGVTQLNYQVSNSSTMDSIAIFNAGTLTLPSTGQALFNFFAPGTSATAYTFGVGVYPLISYGSLNLTGNLASSLSIGAGNNSWPIGDGASFATSTASGPGVLELVIGSAIGSATWTSTGSGSTPSAYNDTANWSPGTIPNGVGQIATFGAGSQSSVSVAGGFILGQLNFNNGGNSGAPTNYLLAGTANLTLNNSGTGASINVSSGGLIPALGGSLTLTLADSSLTTTFNIASDGSLDVAGAINQSGGAQQVVLTGGGTLSLDNGTNTYSGGTTVNGGTLIVAQSSGTSTLGTGPLAINGSSSAVNSNTTMAVGSLSGSGGGQLNVAGSTTLTVNQSTSSTFNGTLTLNGALVLANASGNTLTISGTPTLGSGSSITVNSGTLALTNNTGNSANVTGPATASVASGATLQLAGSSNVLSSAVNITTHGSGLASDGALAVVGTSTQTVGVVSGDTVTTSPVTTYAGNTTVGDGTNAANLTATQILQNTLTINAGSTVTIAPSGSGIPADAVAATAAVATGDAANATATADGDSGSDPFKAIEAAIASGSISNAKGQQLENRIAAIERLAATDPGLDVSLLENRVLAAIPAASVWSSGGSSPVLDSDSGLLAADSSTIGSSSDSALGGATAFAPAADFGGSPELAEGAAVPEPSTLLLAVLGGIGMLIAYRRRTICCE